MKKIGILLFTFSSVYFGISQSSDCVVFPAGPNDFNNATTYPAGSVLFTDAGIDFIKPTTTPGIYPPSGGFQYINNTVDEIFFINQMDLDLSGLPYTCRELTFELISNGFAVDSDTIFEFSSMLPDLPYVGAGFTVDTISASVYKITGEFDMIHIFGSTTILGNVCVQSCPSASCFEFPASTTENFNDNMAYPAGSVLLSSNGIDLVKPVAGFGIYPASGFQYINVNGTQFMFVNQLDIDLTSLSYTCKELTFELIYNGFAVDDDTLFEPGFPLPSMPYVGAGFTVDTLSAGNFIVTGNFDVIHIFGSTAILSNICVNECNGSSCFEFPATTTENFNDNTAYPAGSVLLSSNGINLVKPVVGFGIYPSSGFQFIGVNESQIMFINQLDIDLSNLSYTCRELTFDLIYNGFAVDGDTIFEYSSMLPVLPYNGSGFTVDTTAAGSYVVSGDFDVIHIFGSTSILSNICVSECIAPSCFSFPASTTENFNDNTAYPAGSVLLTSGGIDLVKPVVGFGIYPSSGFQFINVNTTQFMFINQLDIDVSAISYNCKKLTFDLMYNGFAVDGDTIFPGSFALPILPYTGTGFTVDTLNGGTYVVSGNFDVIHIFGSTSILSNICIEPCSILSATENSIEDLELYPNPTSGEFVVQFSNAEFRTIKIYDMTGKLISLQSSTSAVFQFDLTSQLSGVYLIEVITENGRNIHKIIRN